MPVTITANEMHGINRSAVLDVIRRNGPISRTDIADFLKVSLMTVVRIVDELIEEDLIRLTGKKEFSGGRRRPLLEFNAHGHLVIGVDMDEKRLYGAVADLSGEILADLEVFQNPTGTLNFQMLVDVVERLLSLAAQFNKPVRGIGIGAPGITYTRDDKVYWTPALEWKELAVKELLEERFQLPVVLDNDVNLAALGELWFGVGQNCSNLVLMILDHGIGAGIIIDGAVYRGSHLTAGEIGFLLPDRSHLRIPREGQGALESIASGAGIAQRANRFLQENNLAMEEHPLTAEDVFRRFRAGEDWVKPIVAETVDYLAQTVATLTVCYDPDIIILSGGVARSADLLIEPICERILATLPVRPKVVASQLGHKATILGTIIQTLYETTGIYVVRKLN